MLGNLRRCAVDGASQIAIAQDDVIGIHRRESYLQLIHSNVFETYILDRLSRCSLQYDTGIARLIGMNVLHVNVMNRGEVIVIGTLSCIHRRDVEEVLHLVELAVLEVDVLDEPSTVGI